jgi:cysteine-rich repeat protein
MVIPQGGNSQEWFEISSFSATPLDLSGMTISGGSRAEGFTVPFGTVLPANGALVFAASAAAAAGSITAVWTDPGSFDFSEGGDAVELTYGGQRVHRVAFGPGWPIFLSRSMQREDSKPFEEFETSNGWCLPEVLYDPANAGTPRMPRHDCPLCGNSVVEVDEDCDDGNLTDGDGCSSDCRLTE